MKDRQPATGKAGVVSITETNPRIAYSNGVLTINSTARMEGKLEHADGATQAGSAYTVANVLPSSLCVDLGISATTSEPKDAFAKLHSDNGAVGTRVGTLETEVGNAAAMIKDWESASGSYHAVAMIAKYVMDGNTRDEQGTVTATFKNGSTTVATITIPWLIRNHVEVSGYENTICFELRREGGLWLLRSPEGLQVMTSNAAYITSVTITNRIGEVGATTATTTVWIKKAG